MDVNQAHETMVDWCRARGWGLARRDELTWWLLRDYQRYRDRGPISDAPMGTPGVLLLYALASEIDDREVTFTGERVCRACSGRGTVLARSHSLAHRAEHIFVWTQDGSDDYATYEIRRCRYCLGAHPHPTRPDTVALAWLVKHLASQRTTLVDDWPHEWAVAMDRREADGDLSWQAQWWSAFYAWTRGVEPDAERLAGLLRPLLSATRLVVRSEPGPGIYTDEQGCDRALVWGRTALPTAVGSDLDAIASDGLLVRAPGESDFDLRRRIQSQMMPYDNPWLTSDEIWRYTRQRPAEPTVTSMRSFAMSVPGVTGVRVVTGTAPYTIVLEVDHDGRLTGDGISTAVLEAVEPARMAGLEVRVDATPWLP